MLRVGKGEKVSRSERARIVIIGPFAAALFSLRRVCDVGQREKVSRWGPVVERVPSGVREKARKSVSVGTGPNRSEARHLDPGLKLEQQVQTLAVDARFAGVGPTRRGPLGSARRRHPRRH